MKGAANSAGSVNQERFHILPRQKIQVAIESRMRGILEQRNPALPAR